MNHNDKLRLTVHMDVTKAQALSLMAMFRKWNEFSNAGHSGWVAFNVDGDGNFHPHCQIITTPYVKLTDEMYKYAPLKTNDDPKQNTITLHLGHGSDVAYDFDKIAWELRDEEEGIKRHD